jgi:hypothetical protein
MFGFKNKNKENLIGVTPENINLSVNIDIEENEKVEMTKQEEWIWVEGYKGTDKDMKCRDFQYELNKEFKCDSNIELCDKGFHFCLKLQDVFDYYNLKKDNRFFKVKGLVRKEDYNYIIERRGIRSFYTIGGYIDSKIVAKEIVFLEELTYKTGLEEFIKRDMPMIENEEEYNNCNNYIEFCKNKFLMEMKKLGFSDLFSQIQYDNINNSKDLTLYLQRAKAYKEENISKDLMIYLLERYRK